jgi:hypothetical protein
MSEFLIKCLIIIFTSLIFYQIYLTNDSTTEGFKMFKSIKDTKSKINKKIDKSTKEIKKNANKAANKAKRESNKVKKSVKKNLNKKGSSKKSSSKGGSSNGGASDSIIIINSQIKDINGEIVTVQKDIGELKENVIVLNDQIKAMNDAHNEEIKNMSEANLTVDSAVS